MVKEIKPFSVLFSTNSPVSFFPNSSDDPKVTGATVLPAPVAPQTPETIPEQKTLSSLEEKLSGSSESLSVSDAPSEKNATTIESEKESERESGVEKMSAIELPAVPTLKRISTQQKKTEKAE